MDTNDVMAKNYLFIAGTPRSGTTFLMNQLSQHPGISPSIQGASYYFMDKKHPLLNGNNNYYKDDINGFLDIFAENESTFFLDGTDHLMYQKSMMEVLAQLPNKKMIFIFREPAQRIYSSFNFTKNNLGNFKKDISFEMYVDALLNDDKKQIQKWLVSDKRSGFILAHELEYSHYYNYIFEWINEIGKENMIFLSFEEMIKNKDVFMIDLLKQLSLNKIEFNDSENNESYEIKNKRLHRRIMDLSQLFPASSFKDRIKDIYFNFQKGKLNKSKNDDKIINELKKEFIRSNNKLAELTNLDISSWI
jgi:hypothetical protein